jgi:hypothetical protein
LDIARHEKQENEIMDVKTYYRVPYNTPFMKWLCRIMSNIEKQTKEIKVNDDCK